MHDLFDRYKQKIHLIPESPKKIFKGRKKVFAIAVYDRSGTRVAISNAVNRIKRAVTRKNDRGMK